MRQRDLAFWAIPILLCLVATAGLTLRAQSRIEPKVEPSAVATTGPSVQDALNRPFNFPFAKPTPLDEVTAYLGKQLNAPVAIDRAAIERLELKLDDPVQLQLEGVRLKTGLKLLLDQLDLTYQVVPEDNLLIITDAKGSREPINEVLTEIKALHREMHDVQDALEELRSSLGVEGQDGAQMRKPTIIEEVPGGDEPKVKKEPQAPIVPRTRPGV